MEESLLKSNFLGRDGFRWWIGQIAPEEVQKQLNKDGWGNRLKVRIMGYHPYNVTELPDEDLPWAQVLLSTSDGTGSSNYATSHKVRPSDIVFGFFLDGDNAQIPVISGCFGKTSQVPSEEYAGPFIPFTGYTNRIQNDGSRINKNEKNEQTTTSQTTPSPLPPQIANSIGVLPQYGGDGDIIQFATAKPGSKMEKIFTELENAIKFLQDLKSFPNLAQEWIDAKVEELCEQISKKIQGITTEIVSGVVNGTYEKLEPALQQGAKQVYDQAAATVPNSKSGAHLAGVEAQKATIEPVKQLQKLIPCLISSIIESLGSLISDMVCALLKNVANFVSCVIDQFLGGLLNGIIDLIIAGMSAALGALSLLLSFSNFNLEETIRQLAEGLLGIPLSLNCGEEETDPGVEKWTIGSGPTESSSFDINDILSLANNAKSLVDTVSENPLSPLESIIGPLDFLNSGISDPDFIGSGLSNCFGGTPTICNPPSINIFGGGGTGASALPIFGSISEGTGSIIGAILTSGGSGYTYSPFVSITDNCRKGYGAVAESVIKNGQVVAILINSDGEGYTVGNQPQVDDIATGDGDTTGGTDTAPVQSPGQNLTISDVLIINPGYNYQPEDIVTDNFKNEYNVVIDNGSIISITPINITDITDLPIIRVISKTGSGAKLKPVFGFRTPFQGEVKQVIDCVV
jgi:hypothetical protein